VAWWPRGLLTVLGVVSQGRGRAQVTDQVSRAGYDLHALLSVLQQGSPAVVRHDPRSGDFDLAKIGDRYLATSGDTFHGHGQKGVADEGGVRLPLWCTGAACTDPRQPAEELVTDDMSQAVLSR
jgi:hypothetical protein